MELTVVKNALASARGFISPALFQVKKHLPEILVVGGVASVAGGTVLACKATPKAKEIWEDEIVAVYDEGEEEGVLTEREATEKEQRSFALGKAKDLFILYAPGVGLIGGGLAMLVSAKHIEHSRFTAMLGAYSTLEASFMEYRSRVVAEHGPEMDARCINGTEVEKVSYSEKDEETGKTKKAKEEVVIYTNGENPYHRLFDPFNSPTEWQDNMEQNKFFLECQQAVLNQELKSQGRIFLNDVYKRLGFEYCEVGQFVGWLADDIEGCKDGYIDFGIDYSYLKQEIEAAQAEGRRPEPSIWLNFNCDGQVWDKPLKKKHDQYL